MDLGFSELSQLTEKRYMLNRELSIQAGEQTLKKIEISQK